MGVIIIIRSINSIRINSIIIRVNSIIIIRINSIIIVDWTG